MNLPIDLSTFIAAANNSSGQGIDTTSTRFSSQYCAMRQHSQIVRIMNQCTYNMHYRISRWICRQNISAAQGVPGNFYTATWATMVPVTGAALAATPSLIGSTPFQSPQWCTYMKCVSVKKGQLAPGQEKGWKQSSNSKKPALLWAFGNANNTDLGACHRMGGISSFIDLIEVWGMEVPSALTTNVNNIIGYSPVVISLSVESRIELASVAGWTDWSEQQDVPPFSVLSAQQLDPSNLNQAAFVGKSTVTGLLSAAGI